MKLLSSFEKSGKKLPWRQGVTSQKTWNLSSTAARNSNGAQIKLWFLGCDGPLLCCEDGGSTFRWYVPTNLHGITFQNATIFSHRYVNAESKKTYRFTYYTEEEQKWKGMRITLDGRIWYMGSQVIRMATQMTQNNIVTNSISVTDRLMINWIERWWQAVRGKEWFYSNYFITNTQNEVIILSTEVPKLSDKLTWFCSILTFLL